MSTEIEWVSGRLLGALLDGGYQGLLVVAAIWVALRGVRGLNAATRYAVWMGTLLVAAVLPVLHFIHPVGPRSEPGLGGGASTGTMTAAISETLGLAAASPTAVVEGGRSPASGVDRPSPAPDSSWSWFALPKIRHWHLGLPASVNVVLILGWLLLALVRLGGLARQVVLLGGMKRRAMAASPEVGALFHSLKRSLEVARPTRLLASGEIEVPMVAGFLRPAVLLPTRFLDEATEAQLTHVLRHELAHVARWDDWANLLQQGIRAVLFFHPGVVLVSRRLSVEREIACDDHALAAIGSPREYALFLAEFAGRVTSRDDTAAPAAWSNKSQLKERIGMILDGKRNASPRLAGARAATMTVAAVLLAVAAVQLAPRFVVAGEEPVRTGAETGEGILAQSSASSRESGEREKSEVRVEVSVDAPAQPRVSVRPEPRPRPSGETIEGPEPRPRREGRGGDESVERRLERLERMVESIARREQGPMPAARASSSVRKGPAMTLQGPQGHVLDVHGPSKEELGRIQEKVRREVERAHEQMAQVEKDLVLNLNRVDSIQKQNRLNAGSDRQVIKIRREALERQLRTIEKELEALEKQEEALEKEREKIEEGREKEREARDREREMERERREQGRESERELKPKEKVKAGSDKPSGNEENAVSKR